MQTQDGQIEESYSISAGLDFPSVGPEHAHLHCYWTAQYESITDDEALEAFQALAKHEGIIPALESSHALAYALKLIVQNPEKEQLLVVNLSESGDKDIFTVDKILTEEKGNYLMGYFEQKFLQLQKQKQGAFVPFVTLCDPNFDRSFEIICTLVDNGADALELGFPALPIPLLDEFRLFKLLIIVL